MDGQKILVIDDDPDLVAMLDRAFSKEGFRVYAAYDGWEGLSQFYECRPDLVILDLNMPVMDGWQTLSRIRDLSDVPVIVLTVQGSEADTIRGLHAGAVDYVSKPFSVRVLVARAQAALRAARLVRRGEVPQPYDDGYLRVDPAARRVSVRGEPLALTETEYRLLTYLVESEGQVLELDQILSRIWGPGYTGEPQYVRAYMRRLRMKLEPDPDQPRYLKTARGVGYFFEGKAQVREGE
jgi:DNA-binding response OmpR family regulator